MGKLGLPLWEARLLGYLRHARTSGSKGDPAQKGDPQPMLSQIP